MDIAVLEVAGVVDDISVGNDHLGGRGAVTVQKSVAGLKLEAQSVGGTDDVSTGNCGVAHLVTSAEDVSGSAIGIGKGGRLGPDNSSGLVGLLFSGLSDEEVVVGLLEVEFGDTQSVDSVLETGSEVRNESVGIVKSRVGLLVGILGNGELGLSSIIDLNSKVKGVSGSIHDEVSLLFLVKSVTEDLLGIFVGLEGEVIDVLSVEGSSESSFGVLGSLAGLCLSIDEDVVGLLKVFSGNVELLLGSFEVILGDGDDLPVVVDVGGCQLNNLVGSFKDFMSLGFGILGLLSVGSRLADLGRG